MRLNDLIMEVESPFQRGFNAVDRALTPSKWGTGPSAGGTKQKSTIGTSQLKIAKFEIADAQAIMSAVIKGNVSTLSRQQTELAKELLTRLNDL